MSPSAMRLPQQLQASDFWRRYDSVLFDADGVLWRDQAPIDGAVSLVQALLQAGKRVLVVTNNATSSDTHYAEKCQRLGFTGLKAENMVGSGLVLAHQLLKMKRSKEYAATAHLPVYLFGSTGLQKLLKAHGIESFGTGPDPVPEDQNTFLSSLPNLDLGVPRPFAVVGGIDVHMSYAKVMRALNWLRDPSMPFLVTNEDATYPGQNPNIAIPGAGVVTSVLRHVSGREPLVMGKPSRVCWEYICERHGQLDPARTIMIGDRCDTDIHFGRSNGLATLLVLTGVHAMADVERFAGQGRDQCVPDFVVPSLAELAK